VEENMRRLVVLLVLSGCNPNPGYVDQTSVHDDMARGDMVKAQALPDMATTNCGDMANENLPDMAKPGSVPDMVIGPDLSPPPPPPDMTPGPDMTPPPPCGASHQACCAGRSCDTGLNCITTGSGDICVAPVTCGDQGQPCCTSGNACLGILTCQSGSCQMPPPPPCGQTGQVCCTSGPACTSQNTVCSSGSCVACGQAGQPQCPGSYPCQPGYTVSGSTCVACGGLEQVCCVNPVTNVSSCNSGLVCHHPAGNPSICELN
jgi:hypothetical protein